MRYTEGVPFSALPGFHAGRASTLKKLDRHRRIAAEKRPLHYPRVAYTQTGKVYKVPATKRFTRGRSALVVEPPKGFPLTHALGFAKAAVKAIFSAAKRGT